MSSVYYEKLIMQKKGLNASKCMVLLTNQPIDWKILQS
jgi:hypothetical protein